MIAGGVRRFSLAALFLIAGAPCAAAASGPEALTGAALFTLIFDTATGLGPYYNDVSCVACHSIPSIGGGGDAAHAVAFAPGMGETDLELVHKRTVPGYPPKSLRSHGPIGVRLPPSLYGLGLFAALSDAEISAACGASAVDGVRGHANRRKVASGYRVGRFGSKAQEATLRDFITLALTNEMGVMTAPMLAQGYSDGSGRRSPELPERDLDSLVTFVEHLPPPRSVASQNSGHRLFEKIGCAICHQPATGGRVVGAYTDLCLHRMGVKLADGVVNQEAGPDEFRTPPLWGLTRRAAFLHDGRARTIEQAIEAHGGEAAIARGRYSALGDPDKKALMAFLSAL